MSVRASSAPSEAMSWTKHDEEEPLPKVKSAGEKTAIQWQTFGENFVTTAGPDGQTFQRTKYSGHDAVRILDWHSINVNAMPEMIDKH